MTPAAEATTGPLAGVTVLDFTIFMAGPYCTRIMADLGAEVIKIEPPEGDQIRLRPPLRDGHSGYFAQLNCGKKSVVLNLKQPEAIAAIRKLVDKVDVVIENYRPGVMKRLGLDYPALSRINPRLIYCSVSGFGQTGPVADRPAYAPIIHAASGYDHANMTYQPGKQEPGRTGIFVADVLGGLYALSGIQAALIARARTGRGEFIDVSLMDCMLNMMVYEFQEAQFPTNNYRRPVYSPLRTTDGFIIVAPTSQNNFESLADVVGHPEWKFDQRFARVRNREQNWDALTALIEQWTETRTMADCIRVLTDAGIPCSRYQTIQETLRDPHLLERGSFAAIDDGAGQLLVPNQPFRMSASQVAASPTVPRMNQHAEAVLSELAGLSSEEIGQLQKPASVNGGARRAISNS